MLTLEKKTTYTDKDYALLEEGAPFQLINYDLIMSPSPLLIHQFILANFYDALKEFLKASNNKGKIVLSPMDVRLDEGNVYQPDLLFITKERIAEIAKERIEGAPDLVLEILSPSTAYYDLRQKKNSYEKHGVKEYIIIDPIEQSAELYALKDGLYEVYKKAERGGELNSLLLPGLIISMVDIFTY